MISRLKTMRGPNIWATHPCVIAARLEPQVIRQTNSEEIHNQLGMLFQLISRKGNESSPEENIALWFAEVCQLLQQMAGANVQHFSARKKGADSCYAVFEYEYEEVGQQAAKIAEKIFLTLIAGSAYRNLASDIEQLREMIDQAYLGPSTSAIVDEAKRRNIPVRSISDGRYIFLGHGRHQKKIEGSICETTGSIAVDIAGDKRATKLLLEEALIPVPNGIVVSEEKDLHKALEKLSFPLVTKPLYGHQGLNVTTHIQSKEELIKGFRHAQEYSRDVIVERFVTGHDYRFLVVDYKLVAVAERHPASVTGNGKSTVTQLVDAVNSDPKRGEGHGNLLTRITIDETSLRLLKEQGYTPDSVVPSGVTLVLKDTANLSTGGTAIDVTDQVHPDNVLLAERAARVIGLDICGIDIVAPDVSTPLTKNGGAILEVNAAPGLRMHIAPSSGKPRPVGKAIIDLMFPNNSDGRVPIVAVTGTNGKTTTTRLIAHLVQLQGYNTGFTTTEGIYLNNKRVESGDCTGPKSTAVVLHDPTVEFAVLECARGGILRSGLAFDQCDIGIVTNVAEDHLGLEDIYTIQDMTEVKSVIPKSVKPDGYAVLNAANDHTFGMIKDIECKVALFALEEDHPRIAAHCRDGGIACVSDSDGDIWVRIGNEKMIVMNTKDIPLTLAGKAPFMVENVLAATLAAYLLKFPFETIIAGLKSFLPDENQAPGRMNMTDINRVHVMVDYAHNPHSLRAFSALMQRIEEPKTGILTGVGDRRDEDIIEVGRLAAEMYDRIIIRIDDDTRGRTPEEIVALLRKGIAGKDPAKPVEVIPSVSDAIRHAVKTSAPDSYVVVNVEKVFDTLEVVKQLKQELNVLDI